MRPNAGDGMACNTSTGADINPSAANLSVAWSRLRLTLEHCVQDATVHFYALGPSDP